MKLTFFGHSAWGLEAAGRRVLVDPYPVSTNAAQRMRRYARSSLDCVLVTHGAPDHIGISLELLAELPEARLVSEPAVILHARRSGLNSERCLVLVWNGERVIDGWHVRAIEVRHASIFQSGTGENLSGIPLGFIVWHKSEPEVRVIHLGDTSLFSDLRLIGILYDPTVALIGVGAALGYFVEMSPEEGAQAALWLGADVALPMHCEASPANAEAFCKSVQQLPRKLSSWVPEIGSTYGITRQTTIVRKSGTAKAGSK